MMIMLPLIIIVLIFFTPWKSGDLKGEDCVNKNCYDKRYCYIHGCAL